MARGLTIAQKRALRVSGRDLIKDYLPNNIKLNKNNYQVEYRSEWDDASDGITNYQWTDNYILFEGRKYDWEHGVIWFANTSPIDIKNYDELLFDLEITRVDEGPTEIGIYDLERYAELTSSGDNSISPSYYPNSDLNNDPQSSAIGINSTYNRQWISLDLTQWHNESSFDDGAHVGFGMNSGTGGSSSMDWMTCYIYDVRLE